MTDELIKFTPGQRPAHIGPDELVEHRNPVHEGWQTGKPASDCLWSGTFEYRLADPLRRATDDQLEAQCKARGWTVTKPLVTQAERDRLADAIDTFGFNYRAQMIRGGGADDEALAFIKAYEGTGQ